MMESARPLYILAFILIISLVMFSSPSLYYAERGVSRRRHQRVDAHRGVRVRLRVQPRDAKIGVCFRELRRGRRSGGHVPRSTHARAIRRRVPPRARAIAVPVHPSLRVVVGGDDGDGGVRRPLHPRSLLRATVGGLTMLSGILVIALPITVVGSNFSSYLRQVGQQAVVRRQRARADGRGGASDYTRRRTARRRNSSRSTGSTTSRRRGTSTCGTPMGLPCTPAPKRKAAGKQTSRSLEDDTRAFLKGNSLKEPESERVRGLSVG